MLKSTPEQIRKRFDADVERFSDLDVGQSAAIDSPLMMELIAGAASAVNPEAAAILDVGCGAGNYTLRLLQRLPAREVTLIDLSQPMLDRAADRISAQSGVEVETIQGDVRDVGLGESRFDVIVAAMVLHHLRTEQEWLAVLAGFHRALKPGGSLWIADMVAHDVPQVQDVLWSRYGEYLTALGGDDYRDRVFAYIEEEDTPRSLTDQLDLLRRVGFRSMDVLHKNGCFAAFGALK